MLGDFSDKPMDDLGERTQLYEAQTESDEAIEDILSTASYNAPYAQDGYDKPVPEYVHRPSSADQPALSQISGAFQMPGSAVESMFAAVAEEYREISNDYNVGEPIGRGGCAVVLEAWRKMDNMHVVIKVLQVSGGLDEKEAKTAIARFMREAKLIASLHEEHIVQCVDYGCYQGTPCMVLEFIDGLSLDKILENYGALPLAQSTNIIIQLLNALVETHSRKIIHRDIKPSNIMVFDTPPNFEIRVLDFGISSVLDGLQSQTLMTQQGNVRGTPSYMAPELFTGDTHASIESDLYAVGLVYLECLTGEIAVNDKSFMRVAYKQVNEELFIPGSIPPDIATIIRKLCAKKAENRYHSAQVVLDDIRAHIDKALEQEDKCHRDWEKNKDVVRAKYAASKTILITNPSKKVGGGQVKYIVIGVIIVIGAMVGLYLYLNYLNDAKNQPTEPVAAEPEPAPVVEEVPKPEPVPDAGDDNAAKVNELEVKLLKMAIENASKSVSEATQDAYKLDVVRSRKTKPTKPGGQPPTSGGADPRPKDSQIDLPF
ncbi:MAG: protein kinase [Proteobacteria bacterium]|nr:protein kinase [Pseudomonadota bacterium]